MINTTEVERERPEHRDREDQEVVTAPYPELDEEDKEEGVKQVMEPIVCSCGSMRCGAINTFGHPRPVFQGDIEPIPNQWERDRRALMLKGRVLP